MPFAKQEKFLGKQLLSYREYTESVWKENRAEILELLKLGIQTAGQTRDADGNFIREKFEKMVQTLQEAEPPPEVVQMEQARAKRLEAQSKEPPPGGVRRDPFPWRRR